MFSLIQHPDHTKREDFLSRYKALESPRPTSQKKHLTYQHNLIAWESAPHIPVHYQSGIDGIQIWVLGHIEDLDADSNPAEFLHQRYTKYGPEGCSGYSGFFVFVLLDGDSLVSGTDQLGLFPAYYYQSGDYLVLGSSPAAPLTFADIELQPDIYGIVGILLAMHELDNRSIWKGVRRIPAGKLLRLRKPKSEVELLSGAPFPITDKYFSLPFESHVEIADEAMSAAVKRYSHVDVLLSGGLDSRLLAGYLKRSSIQANKCYTLGKKSDIEWKCAHPVSRFLNADHILATVDFSKYQQYINIQISQEQLANGVTDLGWWSLVDIPEDPNGLPLMNGLLGDAILGGSHIPWALDLKNRRYSPDILFNNVSKWGIKQSDIKNIFSQDTTCVVQDIKNAIKKRFQELPGYNFQKSWQYDLLNRQRYHIGGVLFRLAYRMWPAVPYTSNSLLKFAGGVPAASLMQRQIQKSLLRQKFPKLAALPLDNNTLSPRALSPTVPRRVIEKIADHLPNRRRDLRSNCYYHRMFDIGNPGWKPLLEQARIVTCSNLKTELLDYSSICTILDRLINTEFSNDIASHAGYKNLIALALWNKGSLTSNS